MENLVFVDGILTKESLVKAVNAYIEKYRGLVHPIERMAPRAASIVNQYLEGSTLEEIATSHHVTRERVRQIMAKLQRNIGVFPPPPSLEDYIELYHLEELKDDVEFYIERHSGTTSEKEMAILSTKIMNRIVQYLVDSEGSEE